jgi:hypothetical protein
MYPCIPTVCVWLCVRASAEMEHPIAFGTEHQHLSIADPGTVTATEAPTSGFF